MHTKLKQILTQIASLIRVDVWKRSYHFGFACFLFVVLVFGVHMTTRAANPPNIITYQGKLLESGVSVTTTKGMKFVIYDASTGGSAVYTASGTLPTTSTINVTPTAGIFSVDLGDTGTNALSDAVFASGELWLEVTIDGTTLSPRKRLTSVPYAVNAARLGGNFATSTPTTTNYIPVASNDGSFRFNTTTITSLFADTATVSGTASFLRDSVQIFGGKLTDAYLQIGSSTDPGPGGNIIVYGNSSNPGSISLYHNVSRVGNNPEFSVNVSSDPTIGTNLILGGGYGDTNGTFRLRDSDGQTMVLLAATSSVSSYIRNDLQLLGSITVADTVTSSEIVATGGITLGGVYRTTWPNAIVGADGLFVDGGGYLYPATTTYPVVIGADATSTDALLQVIGDGYVSGDMVIDGSASFADNNAIIGVFNDYTMAFIGNGVDTSGFLALNSTTSTPAALVLGTNGVPSPWAGITISTSSISNGAATLQLGHGSGVSGAIELYDGIDSNTSTIFLSGSTTVDSYLFGNIYFNVTPEVVANATKDIYLVGPTSSETIFGVPSFAYPQYGVSNFIDDNDAIISAGPLFAPIVAANAFINDDFSIYDSQNINGIVFRTVNWRLTLDSPDSIVLNPTYQAPVLIGTSTTSTADAIFEVDGNSYLRGNTSFLNGRASISDLAGVVDVLQLGSPTTTEPAGHVYLRGNDTVGATFSLFHETLANEAIELLVSPSSNMAFIQAGTTGLAGELTLRNANNGETIVFDTRATSTSFINAGFLGIGTTTPSVMLTVDGSGYITGTTTARDFVATGGITLGGVYRTTWPSGGGDALFTDGGGYLHPTTTTYPVVIGANTTSTDALFQVIGDGYVSGDMVVDGSASFVSNTFSVQEFAGGGINYTFARLGNTVDTGGYLNLQGPVSDRPIFSMISDGELWSSIIVTSTIANDTATFFLGGNGSAGNGIPGAIALYDGESVGSPAILFAATSSVNSYLLGNTLFGATTSSITKVSFAMDGDDAYVHDLLGVGDSLYVENDVFIGTSTLRLNGDVGNGLITMTGGPLTIDSDTRLRFNTSNNGIVQFGEGPVLIGRSVSTTNSQLEVDGDTYFNATSTIAGNLLVQNGFFRVGSDTISINTSTTDYTLTLDGTTNITGTTTIGGDTLFVNPVSNSVGINTTSPDYNLYVDGTLGVTGTTTFEGLLVAKGYADKPRHVSYIAGSGERTANVNYIEVYGDYLYILGRPYESPGERSGYITVYNISDKKNPIFVANYADPIKPGPGPSYDDIELYGASVMAIQGNYMYVGVGAYWEDFGVGEVDSIEIIDISDPTNFVSAGRIRNLADGSIINEIRDLHIDGNLLYVSMGVDYNFVIGDTLTETSSGIQIYDISNPAAPKALGLIEDDSIDGSGAYLRNARRMRTKGDYLYVATGGEFGANGSGRDAIEIINVSDPYNPTHVTAITTTDIPTLNFPQALTIRGNYLFFTAASSDGFYIFDISDPENPTEVSILENGTALDGAFDVEIVGDYAYVANQNADSIVVIDISDITNPTIVHTLSDSDYELNFTGELALQGRYLFSATYGEDVSFGSGDDGVNIFDIGGIVSYGNEFGSATVEDFEVKNRFRSWQGADLFGGLSVLNGGITSDGYFGFMDTTTNTLSFAGTGLFYSSVTSSASEVFNFAASNDFSSTTNIFSIEDGGGTLLTIDGDGNTDINGTLEVSSDLFVLGGELNADGYIGFADDTTNIVSFSGSGLFTSTFNSTDDDIFAFSATTNFTSTTNLFTIGDGGGTLLSVDGDGNTDINGTLEIDLANPLGFGGGSSIALCKSDGVPTTDIVLIDCPGAPTDLSELYETTPEVEAGDIVMMTNETITYEEGLFDPLTGSSVKDENNIQQKKYTTISVLTRATNQGASLVGVVSTNPAQVLGRVVKDVSNNPQPVAITGRVPVKVNLENGPIAIGDSIGVSDTPGVGRNAKIGDITVGIALESYDGGTRNKIMMAIMPGQYGLLQRIETLESYINTTYGTEFGGVDSDMTVSYDEGTNTIAAVSGSLQLNGGSLLSVGSITGFDGKWSISEDGLLVSSIETSQGRKDLYALQSEKSEIVLSGSSILEDGTATIEFEEIYTEIINPDEPIKITVTLTDEANGIYVSEKSSTGFVVRELSGGTSNATFDWVAIVYRDTGMEESVEEASTPEDDEDSDSSGYGGESTSSTPETNTTTPDMDDGDTSDSPSSTPLVEDTTSSTTTDANENSPPENQDQQDGNEQTDSEPTNEDEPIDDLQPPAEEPEVVVDTPPEPVEEAPTADPPPSESDTTSPTEA